MPLPFAPDPQIEPWNQPAASVADVAARRAARWVWIVAAVEFLLAGCCSMMFLSLGRMSPQQIHDLMSQSGANSEQIAMMDQLLPYATSMAVAFGLLGAVPALVLAGGAFGVQAGRRWAVALCAVIVLMQLLVAGAFLLMVVAVAFSSGQPAQFTFSVIVLGSFLAVLGVTFKHLLAARRTADEDVNRE